ncbi:MAG: 50S ribosomal protein L3, partial [Acidobacteriota bacterium]
MVQGLIGRKLGMSQINDDQGRLIAVTVLRAGPCVVIQKKDRKRDGYEAVQLGLLESRKAKTGKAI